MKRVETRKLPLPKGSFSGVFDYPREREMRQIRVVVGELIYYGLQFPLGAKVDQRINTHNKTTNPEEGD